MNIVCTLHLSLLWKKEEYLYNFFSFRKFIILFEFCDWNWKCSNHYPLFTKSLLLSGIYVRVCYAWHFDHWSQIKLILGSNTIFKLQENTYMPCKHSQDSERYGYMTTIQVDLFVSHFPGEKPYLCTYADCNLSFAENSSLKKHRLTHTGNVFSAL